VGGRLLSGWPGTAEVKPNRRKTRTSTMDKLAAFALVKDARSLITGVNNSLSAASAKQYETAFRYLQAQNLPLEKIANTARSFYFYRAAWVHHYAREIRTALNAADQAARDKQDAIWLGHIESLASSVTHLKQYKPDPTSQHLAKGTVSKWAVEAEKRTRAGVTLERHSKRTRLRGLPTDWRDRMLEGLSKNSKYRDVVAVLSATGARPAEFEKGIKVSLTTDGLLKFTIQGIKTHDGKYGQDVRSFEVLPSRLDHHHLVRRLNCSGGELVITAKAGALSDRVRQLSKRVFPLLKNSVSAYVFRHQISADLKASGMDSVDVSAALGHCVDETKGYYGRAQSARGDGVQRVQSSRPVREITHERLQQLENARGYERDR
jgi:hypothetical protein